MHSLVFFEPGDKGREPSASKDNHPSSLDILLLTYIAPPITLKQRFHPPGFNHQKQTHRAQHKHACAHVSPLSISS